MHYVKKKNLKYLIILKTIYAKFFLIQLNNITEYIQTTKLKSITSILIKINKLKTRTT